MNRFINKFYQYKNHAGEIVAKAKTIFFYSQLFGEAGKNCTIFKPLRLINPQNIKLGESVRIYKDSRIETVERWGDVIFNPEIIIGNQTTFEQRLHLICALKIKIGDGVVCSADVMITDNNHSYNEVNKSVMYQPLEARETRVGDYCFIGIGSKIMAGTKLGNNCIVGSNSVVVGEFPDYSIIVGAPAKIIKRYDFESGKWRRTNSKGDFVDE